MFLEKIFTWIFGKAVSPHVVTDSLTTHQIFALPQTHKCTFIEIAVPDIGVNYFSIAKRQV